MILKTTNAGVNWYFQTFNANAMLTGNYFTSADTGYVVGYYGVIYKTTDGGGTLLGINTVSNQIPAHFLLSQNYPNPFNPVTKISFDIPKQSFVILKIYDMLGREVETLVNDVKAPGYYVVDFNGSELSSGVYFYRFQSAGFTDIKRMLLIR
jgi:uncharacterized protein (DUF2164 family)